MSTSNAEIEGLRARAAQLQSEWRSVRAAAPETRLEAERGVTAENLRQEIVHLESVLVQETKSAGGSMEDAVAAMKRAADVEANVVKAHTKESVEGSKEDEVKREPDGFVGTSSARAAGPSLPLPSHLGSQPVDGGESSSPHLDVVENPNSEMALEGHDTDEDFEPEISDDVDADFEDEKNEEGSR